MILSAAIDRSIESFYDHESGLIIMWLNHIPFHHESRVDITRMSIPGRALMTNY